MSILWTRKWRLREVNSRQGRGRRLECDIMAKNLSFEVTDLQSL